MVVTSYSTVTDFLAHDMQLSGKLVGSVCTIIYGLALHCHSVTHGLPLKIYLGHDGIFICE